MASGSMPRPQNDLTQKRDIRQEPQEGPTGNTELDAELDSLEAHTKVPHKLRWEV